MLLRRLWLSGGGGGERHSVCHACTPMMRGPAPRPQEAGAVVPHHHGTCGGRMQAFRVWRCGAYGGEWLNSRQAPSGTSPSLGAASVRGVMSVMVGLPHPFGDYIPNLTAYHIRKLRPIY